MSDDENSDFDQYTDTEYDTDDENEEWINESYDRMYTEDIEFLENEKQHNQYYIGICKLIEHSQLSSYYVLVNSMSNHLFFKYPYPLALRYLVIYSIISVYYPKIEIMKLQLSQDNTYKIIIKTYWIRIIQRHWKNVLKKREEIYYQRYSIPSLRNYELLGKFPSHLQRLPGLYGMLACYSR